MKTKKIILGTLLALGFFVSCDKAKETLLEEATPLTSSDLITEANIDSTIEDISNLVQDQYAAQRIQATAKGITSILPSCASATFSLDATKKAYTRTIDFGNTKCALNNGNFVRGKIIITFTDNFDLKDGAIRTINYALENFYHNDNLIEGNRIITITRKPTDLLKTDHTVITHSLDTKITFTDKKTYTRKGTLVREITKGDDTPFDLSDNEFTVTGNTTTTLPNGANIINTITSPLIIKASCSLPYPLQGSVKTAKNGYEAEIDFGKGECDNLATFTTRGITIPFELKRP